MRFQSIYKPLQSAYAEINSNIFKPFYDSRISKNVGWNPLDFKIENPNDAIDTSGTSPSSKDLKNFQNYPFFFNRDFSIASMTDAEINYLNSLIVEYKSPFTTRERRNEIWIAFNVAPISLQIQNSAIKSLQSVPDGSNTIGSIKIEESESKLGLKTIRKQYTFFENSVLNVSDDTEVKGRDVNYTDIVIHNPNLNSKLWGKDSEQRFLRSFIIPLSTGRFDDPISNSRINSEFLRRFGYTSSPVSIKDGKQPWEQDAIEVGDLDPILEDLMTLSANLIVTNIAGVKIEGIGDGFLEPPVRQFSAYPPISDQELVFYIRYKYGIAFTADEADGNLTPTLYSIPFVNDEPNVPAEIGQSGYTKITDWIRSNDPYMVSARTGDLEGPDRNVFLDRLIAGLADTFGIELSNGRSVNKISTFKTAISNGIRPLSKFLNNDPYKINSKGGYAELERLINRGLFAKSNLLDTYIGWEKSIELNTQAVYLEPEDLLSSNLGKLSFEKISEDHASFDYRKDTSNFNDPNLPSDWEQGNRNYPGTNNSAPNATQNQSLRFSKIRAYWRALQIIRESEKWALEVDTGVRDGSILCVSGKVGGDEATATPELPSSILFISAKKDPDGNPFHERPWRHLFKNTAGKYVGGGYDSDREIESENQCFVSEKQYMRNIILPLNLWAYIETHQNVPEENWLFTPKQIGETVYALSESIPYKSLITRFFTLDDRGNRPSINTIGSKLSETVLLNLKIKSLTSFSESESESERLKPKNTTIGQVIYNNKDFITILGLFAISTTETLNVVTHHGTVPLDFPGFRNLGHHFYHDAFVKLEQGITAYKTAAQVSKGKGSNYAFAAATIVLTTIGILAGRSGGLTIGFGPASFTLSGHAWSFAFYIGLVIAEKAYYGWKEKEEKEELIRLINEATDQNLLEGPYTQSGGSIRISKMNDGTLPTGLEIDENGNVTNVQSESTERPTISYSISEGITNSNTLTSELVDINASFLNPSSIDKLGKTFFDQVTKEECRELIKIAGKLKNQKSIYTRGESERYNEVLNYAPNYFDVFKYAPRSSESIPKPWIKFKNIKEGLVKFGLDFGSYDKYDLYIDNHMLWNDMYGLSRNSSLSDKKLMELWGKYIKEYDPLYNDYPYNAKLQKMFKYTRYPIDITTELSPLLNGEYPPTEPYYRYNRYEHQDARYVVELSNGPIIGEYNRNLRSSTRNKISDKEKVNLIRRKYGLDAVIPYAIKDGKIDERDPTNGESNRSNFCCDEPKLSLDPLPKCLYVFDFASEAFINELKKSPQCDCDD